MATITRVLAALAAVLLTTTACSGTPAPTSNEIIILSGRDDSVGRQRSQLVERWNKSHTTKARIVELSGSADQQHSEMVKQAQAPDSRVDVFNLDVTWTAEFAEAGYIRKLASPPDADEFLGPPLATARYEGALYALPFNTDAGLLYVNRDFVDGCPADWSAIRDEVGPLLGRPQPRPEAVWAGQMMEYDGLVVNVLETLHALTLTDDDLFAIGLPALQEAVDTLRPDLDPGKVLPDALDFDEEASVAAMQRGRVAMLRGWPVAYGTLTSSSSDDNDQGTPIEVCQLPGRGAVLGGQNLAISSRSAHPDLAEDLVRELTGCKAEQVLFDEGGLAPTRACAYESSARAGDPLTATIREAVEYATPRPQGPCYGRFSDLFSREVHGSLVTGVPLPEGFLVDLRRALDCKPLR